MSQKHLEFDKLLQYITNHCHSSPGIDYLSTFLPSTNKDFINNRLNLITDIQKSLLYDGDMFFYGLSDIKAIFQEIQSLTFNFEELKAIITVIRIGNSVTKILDFLKTEPNDYSTLRSFLSPVKQFPLLSKRFSEIFDEEGTVLDTASIVLKNIRKKIRFLKEKIQSELQRTLNDNQLNVYLQDKIITKRNDRFVVPVKEGFANVFEGISHGRSSSGASIYIEPKVVVHLNNDVNDLVSAEKEEIYRILCEFTKEIREEEESIIINYELLRKLDTYYACARVSNEIQAIAPEIVENNVIVLKRVRHPLLIIKFKSVTKVIPFHLTLGEDFRVLLISGPNTGGKTVTLKTIGLVTLMALTGLPIPADFGSKIGLFSNVFADIGDNQSIESSLSTFSGHIENIKQIVNNGNENSLVLIDEIGSATDPEQGSALAQAVLEQIIKQQSLAVITTHYTSLKFFVENTDNCINASMQFDPDKHEPTYRFDLGFPGNSFAIEIASKLGLNIDLINRAKELTGTHNIELTDLLKKINDEKKKLSENNFQFELKTRLLEIKTSEYDKKIHEIESEKKKLIKTSLADTISYLTGIQKKLNDEIADIKKLDKEERKQKINEISNHVLYVQNDIQQQQDKLQPRPDKNHVFTVGDKVLVRTFDANAVIIAIKNDIYKVDMNGIFFNVKKDDLLSLTDTKDNEVVSSFSRQNVEYTGKAKIELNLLGKNFEESLPLIQELIDNAMYCGLSKVRIVHGRGTGMLRKKIRDYLKKHDFIQDFYSAPHEAGGDGVTVVVLS